MDIKEIRNITSNFNNLQGLKQVPVGAYFLLLGFYNLFVHGDRAADVAAPMTVLAAAILSIFLIQRYYHRRFGRVVETRQTRARNILFVIFAVVVILLAIFIDPILSYGTQIKITLQGLAWGGFFLLTAWWLKRGHYTVYGLVLMAASFLPVFGLVDKAFLFDFREGVLGHVLLGLSLIISGLVDHFYILHNLPAAPAADQEVGHGANI